MKYIVYKITNRENNKSYIGYTQRKLNERWKSHLSAVNSGSKFRFHSAIRKYGIDCWKCEELFISFDRDYAKNIEKELIQFFVTNKKQYGYNANDGGTGGWIVPENKIKDWKLKISVKSIGKNNGNYSGISNEELIDLGMCFINEHGYIPGRTRLGKYAKFKSIKFPATLTKFRFGGDINNFYKILEQKSGLKYNPYFRDEHQKQMARNNLIATNKKRWNKE